jgi:RsiW-degrading membrane proteinase PrsW (M82 family)
MITGALGFAAIENMYYIIDYIHNYKYLQSLVDGGYRFIGATLLHIITSAAIGIFIS